ncbi:MAG: histidine kinase, partial [Actinobacteria bacterium]|nr:histidine kinase [Actinomycetota bacterium]
ADASSPVSAPPAADANGTPPDGFARPPEEGTYRGLPRRVRQASLSPRLRENRPAGADGDGAPGASERSPEEARDLVASLQSGWQRGRLEDSPDAEQPEGPDGQPDAGGSEEE